MQVFPLQAISVRRTMHLTATSLPIQLQQLEEPLPDQPAFVFRVMREILRLPLKQDQFFNGNIPPMVALPGLQLAIPPPRNLTATLPHKENTALLFKMAVVHLFIPPFGPSTLIRLL